MSLRILGRLSLALTLGTLSCSLTAAGVGAAPAGLTVRETREQFVSCGFEVPPTQQNPTSPFLAIRDSGPDRGRASRVVVAIVYTDTATAAAAHLAAHRRAEAWLGEAHPYRADRGPQLLPGYSASVWRGNVALVQSDLATLGSMYTVDAQTDESRVARSELFELDFGHPLSAGVDRDFVACLEDSLLADNVPAAQHAVPVYMPGQPW